MKRNLGLWFGIVFLLAFLGCAASTPPPEDSFTPGSVQLNLKKGETTQGEVLNKFGPPNIATLDGDGNEVWTYQKRARVSQNSVENATITLGENGSETGEGGSGGISQSTRAMTLIIKFDESKIVSNFKSMYTSF